MTGEANERQVVESLRRYTSRILYMQKTLYTLFSLTQEMIAPREDIIKVLGQCVFDLQSNYIHSLSMEFYLLQLLRTSFWHWILLVINFCRTQSYFKWSFEKNLTKNDFTLIHPTSVEISRYFYVE